MARDSAHAGFTAQMSLPNYNFPAQFLDEWLKRNSCTSHHISGTCKMGPDSDPLAVADQHLHVKGVEGLRVANASIMPGCIRATTNTTTIMIGESCAGFIKDGK